MNNKEENNGYTGVLQEKKRSENQKDNSLLKGGAALAVSVIVVKLLGFIYKVPLSYLLGDEGMGYFNSAYTVFTFFYMISSAGIPKAISIMISECDRKNEGEAARNILTLTLKIFSLIGILFTAFMVIFAEPLASFIGNSGAAPTLVCIAPTVLFVCVSGVLRGYLNGTGSLLPIAISGVVEGAVKFVFGLSFAIIAERSGGAPHFISAMTVLGVTLGSFASVSVMAISAKNKIMTYNSRQNEKIDIPAKDIVSRVLRLSLPITAGAALGGVSSVVDLLLIMKRLTESGVSETAAVSLYGNYTTLAVPMMNLLMALVTPISVASMPHLSRAASVSKEELSRAFGSVTGVIAAFAVPASFCFMLFSEPILKILFEDGSASVASPLLVLLSPAIIFTFLLTMNNTLLEATLHTKAPLIGMSVGAIVKTVVSGILIGESAFGISGAPIGSAAGAFASLICSCFLVARKTGVGIEAALPTAAVSLLSLAALIPSRLLYDRVLVRLGASGAVICMVLGMFLYAVLCLFLMPKKVAKEFIMSK